MSAGRFEPIAAAACVASLSSGLSERPPCLTVNGVMTLMRPTSQYHVHSTALGAGGATCWPRKRFEMHTIDAPSGD